MRDGKLLPWTSLNNTEADIEIVDKDPGPGPHWYSVTAEGGAWMYQPHLLAHSSPHFITVKS